MTIAIAYIPVLHQGYLTFLRRQPLDRLLLLSPEIIPTSIEYLHKDLRAVGVLDMQRAIDGLTLVGQVELAVPEKLNELSNTEDVLVLPDEDISRALVAQYFPGPEAATRITYSPIFLRWDKKTATEEKMPNIESEMTADGLQKKWFKMAYHEAGKASDWWRHVGAVVVKDGRPLLTAYNQQLPSEQQSYVDGDARALFHAGEQIELTSAIHAEASLIAHAARAGIALEGTELFVTTFPCPPCAKLVAASGITKMYFSEGYAMFDGELILQAAGVEMIKVNVDQSIRQLGDARSTVVPYPRNQAS